MRLGDRLLKLTEGDLSLILMAAPLEEVQRIVDEARLIQQLLHVEGKNKISLCDLEQFRVLLSQTFSCSIVILLMLLRYRR